MRVKGATYGSEEDGERGYHSQDKEKGDHNGAACFADLEDMMNFWQLAVSQRLLETRQGQVRVVLDTESEYV